MQLMGCIQDHFLERSLSGMQKLLLPIPDSRVAVLSQCCLVWYCNRPEDVDLLASPALALRSGNLLDSLVQEAPRDLPGLSLSLGYEGTHGTLLIVQLMLFFFLFFFHFFFILCLWWNVNGVWSLLSRSWGWNHF